MRKSNKLLVFIIFVFIIVVILLFFMWSLLVSECRLPCSGVWVC